MPYKPNQVGEEERSRAYPYMWFAAASSPVNFALIAFGVEFHVGGIFWGFTLGGMCLAAFGSHADEFMRGRLEIAMRFAIGAIALFMLAALMLAIFDLAHLAGHAFGSGELPEGGQAAYGLVADTLLLTSIIAVIFYIGYAFAVLRENWDGLPFAKDGEA